MPWKHGKRRIAWGKVSCSVAPRLPPQWRQVWMLSCLTCRDQCSARWGCTMAILAHEVSLTANHWLQITRFWPQEWVPPMHAGKAVGTCPSQSVIGHLLSHCVDPWHVLDMCLYVMLHGKECECADQSHHGFCCRWMPWPWCVQPMCCHNGGASACLYAGDPKEPWPW